MPIQTVESRRLYRQIADQLRVLIRAGEYEVGTRLPPERDLASLFGVSRPSIREALVALELDGLVEVRAGSGVHVLAREATSASAGDSRTTNAFGPFEIIRARQLMEGELAAVAAEHMTPAQIDGLRESIDVMQDDIAQGITPLRGDRLFHLRIVEAVDNAPLQQIVANLFDERNNPLFEQFGAHFENAPSWRAAVAEHQAVIDAIAKGHASAARLAMQKHLGNSQDRFADAWPQGQATGAPTRARTRRAAQTEKETHA